MAAVTGASAMAGSSYLSWQTPSLEAALTADLIAGVLSGLGSAWQGLYPGIRVFGRLTAIGGLTQLVEPGTLIPFATLLVPVGPGQPQAYTVTTLAAALLALNAEYGAGPVYTYTPAGYAAVTKVRTTINGLTEAPYSVELAANPIQGGLTPLLA